MSKLPVVSGQELVKLFNKLGYEVDHQTGSHVILRQGIEPYRRLTVPNHKEISKSTLSALIKQAGLTRDEFMELI